MTKKRNARNKKFKKNGSVYDRERSLGCFGGTNHNKKEHFKVNDPGGKISIKKMPRTFAKKGTAGHKLFKRFLLRSAR